VKSILVVLGTRPEVVKLAPVIHALKARAGEVDLCVCSTAQHRQMLDDALAAFEITPDRDLALMRENQRLGELMGRMALALQPVIDETKPDVVVVQGDTLTVMVAALVAFLNGAQVAHVEAGLRTDDKRAPFPEEIDRRVAGVVADHHFAPTAAARDALLREGVAPEAIRVTGNTGIDALFWMRERLEGRPLPEGLDPAGRRLVLVTAHRRESFGAPLREAFGALRELVQRFDDVQLVYPVHLNPNVQEPARELLGGHPRIALVDPLPYPDLAALLLRAEFVITDSGGLQEEAPSLGKPVLVLREKTERPEAVAAGGAKLVGTDRAAILREATALLSDPAALAAMARPRAVYGDGRAAARVVETLVDGTRALPDFVAEKA
jgi:UDP-N-acetylglucosamine 2-epimerase